MVEVKNYDACGHQSRDKSEYIKNANVDTYILSTNKVFTLTTKVEHTYLRIPEHEPTLY